MNLELLNESAASVNVDKMVSKFVDKKKQISPKKLTNWVGLKKFTIEKEGPNMTLKVGEDTKESPLKTFIHYVKTKNYIDVTLPMDLTIKGMKVVEDIVVKIVKKFDEDGKPSSYKELAVKVLPGGLKLGRVKKNKNDGEYSEEDDKANDKGANRDLEAGETIRIYVGKVSTKMPKILKESIKTELTIETKKDKDGDTVHTVKHVDFSGEVENLLYALFDKIKNPEDVYDWIKDLPLGDTIEDIQGNGFVVSDITDHIDKNYDDYVGFEKGRND